MQTKTCTKCNIEKELTEFHSQARGKYGVRAECKICTHSRNKKWVDENPTKIALHQKKYAIANPENRRKNKYNYVKNNYIKVKESQKQYHQTPQGKSTAKSLRHKRRALEKNATGSHTGKQILELFDKQNGKCVYCECKLHKTRRNSYHLDHIVPLSKGGSNDISNIQLLCPKCNLTKSDKLPEEFAANFGKLL